MTGYSAFFTAALKAGDNRGVLVPDEDELVVVVPPVLLGVHAGLDVVA